MIDTARHYLHPTAIRGVLDVMAALKLNVLHIHLSDDDAWPLVVDAAPRLAQTGAYSNHSHTYTRADMQALADYAAKRAIRLVPEVRAGVAVHQACAVKPTCCPAAGSAVDPSGQCCHAFRATACCMQFDTPSHFGVLFNAYPQYATQAVDPSSNTSFLCMVRTALHWGTLRCAHHRTRGPHAAMNARMHLPCRSIHPRTPPLSSLNRFGVTSPRPSTRRRK